MLIPILRRFGIWLSYLILSLAGIICFLFFRFPFNFARIRGTKHIPRKGQNILFLSNHDTMYDSFLIGVVAFFPRMILYPSEPFVNFAAKENYFGTWYLEILMQLLRAEPVARRDQALLMKKYVELLQKRNLLIFYQGGRSKNLDQIRLGPSFAIRNKKPTPIVILLYHEGMDRIFSRGGPNTKGVWRWLPRNLFRRPTIIFGEPIDFSDILKNGTSKNQTSRINQRIITAIKQLKQEYEDTYKKRIKK